MNMKKNTITTLQRVIAYNLLISQLLISCGNPVINPQHEALYPITKHQTIQENPQPEVIVKRYHKAVVARPDSEKLNLKQEHTAIINPTKRPRKAITIPQPVGSAEVAQLNCLPSQKLFTEQVQQEVHKRIEQTLANPIWRKHLLEDKSRDRKTYEVNTIQQHAAANTKPYQPARVHTALQPLTPALTLPMKDGMTIRFIQDMNHWWGVVEETYPGFSRSTVLPVLYQQSLHIPTNNGNHAPPTIETLSQLPLAIQQQLAHIFSSNKTLRDAFIYIGEQMGLNGGGNGGSRGWLSLVGVGLIIGGICILAAPVAAAVSTAALIVKGCVGVGWIVSGISCLINLFLCNDDNSVERKKAETKSRVEEEQRTAETNCKNAINNAKDVADDVKNDPQSYKNRAYMQRVFQQLNSYRNTIDSAIKHLEQVKKNIEDMYDDFELSGLESSISDRKRDRDQVDKHIQDAKDEFKRQAQVDLKKDRNEAEEAMGPKYAELHKQMSSVAFNRDLDKKLKKVEKRILAASEQIKANIEQYKKWKSMYEDWQREFAIDTSAEVKQLNDYLDQEKARQKKLSRSYGLTRYMRVEDNMKCIQSLNESYQNENAKNIEKRNKILNNAVEQGDESLLFYAFMHTPASPNMVIDKKGTTLLHLAVKINQAKVVELCLDCGGNKLTKNRDGKTPVDLAANKPEIRKLLEEKK